MDKYAKRAMKYFVKYPNFNAGVHAVAGLGLGFLLAYPLAGTHPVRWGLVFFAISILGHLWAATH